MVDLQTVGNLRWRACDGYAFRSLSQLQTEFFSDLGKGEMLGTINLNAWQAMMREHASLKRAEPAAGIPKAFQSQHLHVRRQPKAFPFRRGRNVNGMAHRGKAHLHPLQRAA